MHQTFRPGAGEAQLKKSTSDDWDPFSTAGSVDYDLITGKPLRKTPASSHSNTAASFYGSTSQSYHGATAAAPTAMRVTSDDYLSNYDPETGRPLTSSPVSRGGIDATNAHQYGADQQARALPRTSSNARGAVYGGDQANARAHSGGVARTPRDQANVRVHSGGLARTPPRSPRVVQFATDYSTGVDHTSAKPSVAYDPLADNTGCNEDANCLTAMGIEIRERFTSMRKAFLKIDHNRDGRISKRELMEMCRDWNIPLSEAQRVVEAADLNDDGSLDFNEFAQRFDPYDDQAEERERLRLLAQAEEEARRQAALEAEMARRRAEEEEARRLAMQREIERLEREKLERMRREEEERERLRLERLRREEEERERLRLERLRREEEERLERLRREELEREAARRLAEEEERRLARLRAEEEARLRRLEEEARLRRLEEEARLRRLEEEARLRRLEEEARLRRLEEEARLRRLEEEDRLRRLEEEERLRLLEEEARRQRELSPEEQLRALFKKWDVNQDGYIDRREFKDLLTALGMPTNAAEQTFNFVDRDGNGEIDIDEFIDWMFGKTKPMREEWEDEVVVFGQMGEPKTDVMCKKFSKVGIDYQFKDYDTDKRFEKLLRKHGYDPRKARPPVVCYQDKVWCEPFREDDPDNFCPLAFHDEVAMELRRLLGMYTGKNAEQPVRDNGTLDEEIAERFLSMKDAFLKLDEDRDGVITVEELRRRCREWHIPKAEADRIIAEADRDRDGNLDFNEFAKRFNSATHHRLKGQTGLAARPSKI
eukprot:TRINITY_DN3944_c0_g1_i2.p1 TRINITY_DN3944_c0_g1~~TRINITY_DN3944_c0_g1_i2.p1  ORF type:complete len:775 (-),score=220.41 TRINITY_DN3944_c0_g1_i2:314-2638(-)